MLYTSVVLSRDAITATVFLTRLGVWKTERLPLEGADERQIYYWFESLIDDYDWVFFADAVASVVIYVWSAGGTLRLSRVSSDII